MQGRWRVQERSERSAQQMEQPVHDAHDEPYCRTITRIDHQQHAPGECAGDGGQAHAVGRAAHNAIQDDDIGGRHGLGVIEHVGESKDAPIFNPLVVSELPRVWLVRRDEFDNLSAARPRNQQLRLNGTDASSDFKNSSTGE